MYIMMAGVNNVFVNLPIDHSNCVNLLNVLPNHSGQNVK